MSENSKIEWTDHTFNPWEGCTKVSPGCANCYAESRNHRWGGDNWGKGKPRRRTSVDNWKKPLKWNRNHQELVDDADTKHFMERGVLKVQRQRVFSASLADWLDDEVPIEWLADFLKLIYDTPNLDWLLLTKRPENFTKRLKAVHQDSPPMTSFTHWVSEWLNLHPASSPPPNVWIGTSVEDQQRADERIPELLRIPAAVRFLSVEPLLGPVDLHTVAWRKVDNNHAIPQPWHERQYWPDWVIVGGESGPKSRPCNVEWIRSIVRQCQAAGVPCFVKQLGSNAEVDLAFVEWQESYAPDSFINGVSKAKATIHPKGGDMAEWPEDLRVREFPV